MEWNNDLTQCPDDKFVHVIADNYKRYKVAKHCSCCGLWSDEDGNPVFEVSDWKPYMPPVEEMEHRKLDKIIGAWLADNYDFKHAQNSIRKHLGTDKIEDCTDIYLKRKYYSYLVENVV
jgi:hypothetical protein